MAATARLIAASGMSLQSCSMPFRRSLEGPACQHQSHSQTSHLYCLSHSIAQGHVLGMQCAFSSSLPQCNIVPGDKSEVPTTAVQPKLCSHRHSRFVPKYNAELQETLRKVRHHWAGGGKV